MNDNSLGDKHVEVSKHWDGESQQTLSQGFKKRVY